MNLSHLTNPNLVILDCDITTKYSAIKLLVKKLYEDGKITSEQEFFDVVYARESLSFTGLESGLAFPHGASSCVKDVCFAVMTTKEPIFDWESLDLTNKVSYVFLIAIPENNPSIEHLDLLSELMSRLSGDEYKNKLFSSSTVDEFYLNIDNKPEPVEDDPYLEKIKTIIAVTSCPVGVAHTYMAAEALIEAGKELGVKVYVEKQGANGIVDRLTFENIQNADGVIFAVDIAVKEINRFDHLPHVKVPVAWPIKDGVGVLKKAIQLTDLTHKNSEVKKYNHKDIVRQSVLTGISYMIPIIIVGGVIGALSVLLSNIFDLAYLYDDPNSWLGMFRALGYELLGGLLIPILSAYMAYSIGDKTALVTGFSAGVAANLINGGFLSGMVGGLMAGYIVLFLKDKFPATGNMAGVISFWFYPVVSSIAVTFLMFTIIEPPISILNSSLTSLLGSMVGTNAIALGIIIGIMVSFDLGGPVNKAAYTFCIGAITEGFFLPYAIFSSVKMVSGFAVTFATLTATKYFSSEERNIGKSTWILALAGITEGSIPLMMRDPINVIFSLCTGSAIAGGLVAMFNIGLDVPGAGIFSIFLLTSGSMTNVMSGLVWFGCAIFGAIISAVLLVFTRYRVSLKSKII